MKKKNIRFLAGLVLCAMVLAFCAFSLSGVDRDLQYLIPAPALEMASPGQGQEGGEQKPARPNQAAEELLGSLETAAETWSGTIQAYTFSGILEKASIVSDTEETKQARLTALWESAFLVTPKYLHFGRLFYPEELKKGAAVILLDEQLALALFKIAQPVGRTVKISGIPFTVVGILRHTKGVGDSEDYGAYVPLSYLWDKQIQLQALMVTARPIPGAGARAAFAANMESWKSGGTLIDLGKEAMGALLPLRVLLFFAGITVFFRALSLWNGLARRFWAGYRRRLDREYAVKLMPRLVLELMALAAGYGALTLGAAMLIQYIVAPVYTFTEWVPAVLVEWQDIKEAFFKVWQAAAALQELRSTDLSRIRFFGMVTAWFSALAAVLLTALWTGWWAERGKKEHV